MGKDADADTVVVVDRMDIVADAVRMFGGLARIEFN